MSASTAFVVSKRDAGDFAVIGLEPKDKTNSSQGRMGISGIISLRICFLANSGRTSTTGRFETHWT